jgi:hypothetical protein
VILCEWWLKYFAIVVATFDGGAVFGRFVYFIVNLVFIFAEISIWHVKLCCVNWNSFEIIPSYAQQAYNSIRK